MCEGSFSPSHKLVLSTCSEYFEQIFEKTECKHPFIVLTGIKPQELEALLTYMYEGSVNVTQDQLRGVMKAAECLQIKGLAVPDQESLRNDQIFGQLKSKEASNEERLDTGCMNESLEPMHIKLEKEVKNFYVNEHIQPACQLVFSNERIELKEHPDDEVI